MPRNAYVVEYGNIVSVYKMCVDKERTRQTLIITEVAAESRTKERALASQISSKIHRKSFVSVKIYTFCYTLRKSQSKYFLVAYINCRVTYK